jgi:hypothetical protein
MIIPDPERTQIVDEYYFFKDRGLVFWSLAYQQHKYDWD